MSDSQSPKQVKFSDEIQIHSVLNASKSSTKNYDITILNEMNENEPLLGATTSNKIDSFNKLTKLKVLFRKKLKFKRNIINLEFNYSQIIHRLIIRKM